MARDKKTSVATSLDRRRERRHAVERPCRVTSGTRASEGLGGVTLNISREGMLIKFPEGSLSSLLPKVGAAARVVIDLPRSANYAARSLECTGRVVRDEASGDDAPVLALRIQRMQVRDHETHPRPAKQARKELVQ
jgi:hypothetical protein